MAAFFVGAAIVLLGVIAWAIVDPNRLLEPGDAADEPVIAGAPA